MIAKRMRVPEGEIGRKAGESHGPENVANRIGLKESAEGRDADGGILKDVEVVVHRKTISEGIGVDDGRNACQQGDGDPFLHAKSMQSEFGGRTSTRAGSFARRNLGYESRCPRRVVGRVPRRGLDLDF